MTKKPHPLDVPPFLSRKGDKRTPEQHAADFKAAADEYRAAHPEQFVVKAPEEKRPILGLPGEEGAEEKPMVKKTKATKKKAPAVKAEPGYKGHKAGSKIEQLHKCYDEKGEEAARKMGDKLGLAGATINIQLSRYRNEGGGSKKSKGAGSAKAKPKASKPAKGKAAAKRSSANRHAEIVG